MNAEVFSTLKRLEDNNHRLDQDVVIERARDKLSPLHPRFEWNDTLAAHTHRRHQATQLIREYTLEISIRRNVNRIVVPYYLHDPDCGPGERGYRTFESIRPEPESVDSVMERERKLFISIGKRYLSVAAGFGRIYDVELALLELRSMLIELEAPIRQGLYEKMAGQVNSLTI